MENNKKNYGNNKNWKSNNNKLKKPYKKTKQPMTNEEIEKFFKTLPQAEKRKKSRKQYGR